MSGRGLGFLRSDAVALRVGRTLTRDRSVDPIGFAGHGHRDIHVTPAAAGRYFNKIECFCFTEQSLGPGDSAELPVSFFVDPELVNDPNARNITEITLSYTFFRIEDAGDVAATRDDRSRNPGS